MILHHAAPIEQVQVQIPVAVPHQESPPTLCCKDFTQYNLLALHSTDEAQAILTACKPLAHEFISHRPDLETSPFQRGIRWAATTQLLQAVLTGEQEACLYEFNEANGCIIGADVGFIQRALDEEVSETVDAGLCPHDEEGISHAAIRVLTLVLETTATH